VLSLRDRFIRVAGATDIRSAALALNDGDRPSPRGPRYSHPISEQHVIDQEVRATLTVNELPHLGDHHRPLADRRGYALDRSRAHVTHCEHAGLRGCKRGRN
jgi:hypothetical protein